MFCQIIVWHVSNFFIKTVLGQNSKTFQIFFLGDGYLILLFKHRVCCILFLELKIWKKPTTRLSRIFKRHFHLFFQVFPNLLHRFYVYGNISWPHFFWLPFYLLILQNVFTSLISMSMKPIDFTNNIF